MENLTGYDDVVFEFALCTFNLLMESGISPGCLYELNVVLCATREITVFVILQQQMKYTLSRIKENHSEIIRLFVAATLL